MNKATDLIVVTGATGKQGGATARQLLSNGYRVRAVTRKPDADAAKDLAAAGAEVVAGDLDDVASLERAVRGAWGVFGVQNTWEAGVEREEEQGMRLAEVSRKAGVQHYVYASVGSADRATGVPHFDNKFRVEQRVRALGFPSHVVLRPVFFMENWHGMGLANNQLQIAIAPETKLQMIAVADIGKFGRLAFERHEALNGQAIDIAGDELTIPDAARILTRVLGRPVEHVRPPIEAVRQWSADMAAMLEWFDRVGYDVDIPSLETTYGIPRTTFEAWARATLAG